ncbi:MAG: hypothetical protein KF894_04825 [Labilithrix sp.]|nr:hypothetical protein [Labilithrix sp.]
MSVRFAPILVLATTAAACGLGITGAAPDGDALAGDAGGADSSDAAGDVDAGGSSGDAEDQVDAAPDADADADVNSLTLTTTTPGSDLDLDIEGTAGWAHWGFNANTNAFNQHASFVGAIPTFQVSVPSGGINLRTMSDNRTRITWAQGTPTAVSTGTLNGVYSRDNRVTFTLRVPLSPATSELALYAGLHRAKAEIVVTLGDEEGAPVRAATFDFEPGNADFRFAIAHRVASDTMLTIRWSMIEKYDQGNSNVTLVAATLR